MNEYHFKKKYHTRTDLLCGSSDENLQYIATCSLNPYDKIYSIISGYDIFMAMIGKNFKTGLSF